jgi:O-antigen/teichoic acid export membrane protein
MRLSRAFLLTLLTREAALACAFINSVVLSRVLGAASMGTYSLVVTTANLLALAGSLGLNYSNTFMVARRQETAGQLVTHSFLPALVLGGVAVVTDLWLPGVSSVLFGSLSPDLRRVTWIGAALLIVNLNLAYILYGLQRLKRHSIVTALTAAGTGLTNAVAVTAFHLQVAWALRVWLIWNVVTLVVTILLLVPVARPVWGLNGKLLVESVRVGFRALTSAVLGYASGRGVLILVDRILGAAAVGHFSVATQMAELVQHAPSALGGLVFTKASAQESGAAQVARIIRLHWVVSGFLGIGLALAAPWIVTVLFAKNFSASVIPFQILVLANYFSGVWTLASSYVGGRRGMPWTLIAVTAGYAGMNLMLCALCIPSLGLTGAALAAVASAVVTSVVMLVYFLRVSEGEVRAGALLPKPGDLVTAWKDLSARQGGAPA